MKSDKFKSAGKHTNKIRRVYSGHDIFTETLNRFRYLFKEFDYITVSYSGGKDSTVVFNIALQVARELNKLPLRVMFLDQEAEYQATIDEVEKVMSNPDVEPVWLQIPIKLFNATSSREEWLECWKEGEEWMRPKNDIAFKENIFGTDRFVDMFFHVADYLQKKHGGTWCDITGIRTQESMGRFMGVTHYPTYKDITWGKKNEINDKCLIFHPIYDWSYSDIWKAIHDNNWHYNKVYDMQYQYGTPIQNMRVSNLHHETAVRSLFYLQEFEPDTYNKLTKRIAGMDTAGKLGFENYFVKKLPFMFKDWREYRDYLLKNLILSEEHRKMFKHQFDASEKKFGFVVDEKEMFKLHINCILTNDWHGTKLKNAMEHSWNFKVIDYYEERGMDRNGNKLVEKEV